MENKFIDELRKLPPKERLERLKQIEEEIKQQEEDAKKLAEDSINELKLDEMLQELSVERQEANVARKLLEESRFLDFTVKIEDEKRRNKNISGVFYMGNPSDRTSSDASHSKPDTQESRTQSSAYVPSDESDGNTGYTPSGKRESSQTEYKTQGDVAEENLVESKRLKKSMGR